MAVVTVYTAQFSSQSGDTFRFDIVDLNYGENLSEDNTTYGFGFNFLPLEMDVIHESAVLSWEGDSSQLAQPIIGSKFEITALLEEDQRGLIDAFKKWKEHRLCCEIYRHNGTTNDLSTDSNWDIYWRGTAVNEAITYAFSCYPLEVKMTFTDGLALLKDQPYLNPTDDSDYLDDGLEGTVANSSFAPLRVQIGRCLNRLPHNALWDAQENYFTEQLDLFHWNHIDETADPDEIKSILDKTGCDQRVWYEIRDYDGEWYRKSKIVTNGSTCYQILEDIMVTMGATLHHSGGLFNVRSPFMQESDSVNNSRRKWVADKRSMITTGYLYSAYSQPSGWADGTTLSNYLDYSNEDDQKYLISSSRSYLTAVKRVSVTHLSGGAPLIFSQKHNKIGYINGVTGAVSGAVVPDPVNNDLTVNYGYNFPLINSEAIVVADSELNLRGKVTFTHDLLGSGDDDWVGEQPVLVFKIKVGNYYLKQNVTLMSSSDFTNDSDFGTIRIPVGNVVRPSGNDITGWLPVQISSAVEWTQTSTDRFEIPLLLPEYLQETHDTIEYDDGTGEVTEYPVGFMTYRANNHPNQMKSSNSEMNGSYERTLELDIVLPPVPDAVAEHTSVQIDVEVKVYKNTGQSVTGTTANNSDPFQCIVRDFQLFNGDEDFDQDTFYFANLDDANGTETIDVGETLIGTRPDDMYGEMGALAVGDGHRTTNRASVYGDHWFSESMEAFPTSSSGSKNLELVAKAHMSNRYVTINTFDMEVLTRDHHTEIITPTRRVKISEGTSEPIMQVTSCSHNLMQGVMLFTAYEVDRTFTSIVSEDSHEAYDTLPGRKGGKGVLPGDYLTTKIAQIGSGGTGLTAEQIAKLAAIIIDGNGDITDFTVASGSDPLDVSEVSGAASTTTVATLQQRVSDIERVTDNVTLDQANNISQIATNQDAIAANSILQTSTKQFVTQAQSVQIGTNETDIANLNTTLDAVTDVIKGSTAGTGKGLYSDTNSTTESSVVVNANLISASVETGSSGTETSTTALRITGGTTAGDATVNFDVPTAGISHDDLDDRPPLYHGIGLDAAGTGGFLIGSGSVSFAVGDLLSFTYNNNAGIYQCITATSISQGSNATNVFTNWLAEASKFTHVGARGDLSLGTLDSSTSSDSFSDSLTTFTLTCSSNVSITSSSLIGLFGTVFSTGSITAAGFTTTGTGTIGTLVASSLNYPTSDGTSGQALVTDGSGNLSFSTISSGLTDIVDDTTPQLGADLDMFTNSAELLVTGNVYVFRYHTGSAATNYGLFFNLTSARFEFLDGSGNEVFAINANNGKTKVANSYFLPTADGSSGQTIQTDGSGNLSFVTPPPIPLTTISGRWQWSSTDSNERVMTGLSSYGPFNWYSHTTEPSDSTILTYTGTEVVDSTSGSMAAYYHQSFGMQIPTNNKKVRVDFMFRMQNMGSGANIGMSLWGADLPSNGTTSNITWTLRGQSADVTTTSTSTVAIYSGSFTTNSVVTEDTLLPMWEHRGGTTLATTAYIFGNFNVYLVD